MILLGLMLLAVLATSDVLNTFDFSVNIWRYICIVLRIVDELGLFRYEENRRQCHIYKFHIMLIAVVFHATGVGVINFAVPQSFLIVPLPI